MNERAAVRLLVENDVSVCHSSAQLVCRCVWRDSVTVCGGGDTHTHTSLLKCPLPYTIFLSTVETKSLHTLLSSSCVESVSESTLLRDRFISPFVYYRRFSVGQMFGVVAFLLLELESNLCCSLPQASHGTLVEYWPSSTDPSLGATSLRYGFVKVVFLFFQVRLCPFWFFWSICR